MMGELCTQASHINSILRRIKSSFVGKGEIIDLIGLALVDRGSRFMFGRPGTAKSALVHAFNTQADDSDLRRSKLARADPLPGNSLREVCVDPVAHIGLEREGICRIQSAVNPIGEGLDGAAVDGVRDGRRGGDAD